MWGEGGTEFVFIIAKALFYVNSFKKYIMVRRGYITGLFHQHKVSVLE